MNVWVVIVACLGAASAAPCTRCGVARVRREPVVVVEEPPVQLHSEPVAVVSRGLGTRAKADVSGTLVSTGNARAVASGGSRSRQQLPGQQGAAAARLKLNTQRDGLGTGSAAAAGRSDVDPYAASSQGDAATRTASAGEATTEADAKARGGTAGHSTRTDARGGSSSSTVGDGATRGQVQTVGTAGQHPGGTDAGSGAAAHTESSGSGGSRAAGRGGGAATDGVTTSRSDSQSRSDVLGTSQSLAVEKGGAGVELREVPGTRAGRTQATAEGKVRTRGPGASGVGETASSATAGDNSTTAADSQARNRLQATRSGTADSDLFSTGLTTLRLDPITGHLIVNTKSQTRGEQTTAGSAKGKSNAASLAGSSLLGAGDSVSDTTFSAESISAGHIKGQLQTSGQTTVTEGRPVVQARKPTHTVVIRESHPAQPVVVAHHAPYEPPVPTHATYVPPYVRHHKPKSYFYH